MRNLHKDITERILVSLKAGALPWRKPWSGGIDVGAVTMPRNGVTARQYSGINVLLLWAKADQCGFADPRWLTFKQALELGGNVRKGEKGTEIVFVSKVARDDKRNPGETVFIPFLKSYWVFNVAQCENLAKLEAAPSERPLNVSRNERDATIDEFVSATGADVRHGATARNGAEVFRAFYQPGADFIGMPTLASFESAHAYYATLFHELGHWTGGEKRLNRIKGKRFGDREYAYEELVAELASAFVCAEFGIDNHEQNAAYLASWLRGLTELLEANDRAIVSAAAEASKAVEYMRGLAAAAGELEPVVELPIAA